MFFKGLWRLLDEGDFEPGYITKSRKDASDSEWHTFARCFVTSMPFMILHALGTQFFQRNNQKVIF